MTPATEEYWEVVQHNKEYKRTNNKRSFNKHTKKSEYCKFCGQHFDECDC